jgi:uncharacterized protein YukJ
MPLRNYGVLAARVLDTRAEGGSGAPHFQIRARGGDVDFRVAVNVLSQQSPSELLYAADEAFEHPVLNALPDLPDGFSGLPSTPGQGAFDYIRGNLFDRESLRPLPATAPGPDNDLADKLHHYVDRAQADPSARLYAFGERWGPEDGLADKIFGFSPGNGVHDIHMNQGNTGQFRRDDGVWQDGGLLLHYPAVQQWVAIFLAFQSQSWHTDDRTGHTLPGVQAAGPVPGPGEPDHVVRIVAALVTDAGQQPGRETVTLLNTGVQDLDLAGWALLDAREQRMPLPSTRLPAGEAARIPVQPPFGLGGEGGLLTLLDPAGLKVDGVAYTERQAQPEGRTIVF